MADCCGGADAGDVESVSGLRNAAANMYSGIALDTPAPVVDDNSAFLTPIRRRRRH
jgi:hypothetical protein